MYRLPFPPMPSGKRARQQRQAAAATAPPPVRSKGMGGARARQASPRALAIGGGVVLAIVIAIVLDIPQNGLTLGDPKAPITMEMFIDVQCPVCQSYEVTNLPTVVKRDIATGKVQLNLKPWAFIGPQSTTGRLGLIAAADQNKAYEYAKLLYDNQGQEESGWLDGREMALIAASVNGLDLAQWRDDANSSASQSTAKSVDKLATQKNVQGTPTILVGCTGGKLQNVTTPSAAPTLQDTQQAIDAANCS